MSKIEEAKIIIHSLQEQGFEAYIIGGYVRDLLLNKQNEDIDITTNAMPDDVKKIFPKTFLTGVKHGTVTVLINNNQYEITTCLQIIMKMGFNHIINCLFKIISLNH